MPHNDCPKTNGNSVELLAKLLSDPDLRDRFAQDPDSVLRQQKLTQSEYELMAQLSIQQVNIQAALLIKKRLREIHKIIPLTLRDLGDNARSIFEKYAGNYWPDTHRRHEQDAAHFCQYLHQNKFKLNKSEWNRMRFVLQRQHYGLGFAADALIRGKKTFVLQLLYRYKSMPREWRLYLQP